MIAPLHRPAQALLAGAALLALGACQTTGNSEAYKAAFAHGQKNDAFASTSNPDVAPKEGLDTYQLTDLKPGQRPELTTDEAGLWMMMDKAERKLATSGNRVTDPRINAYVEDMVCRIAGEYCADFRVYVMRVPAFNATMAPNGTMAIYSGLLMRAENEAQVAAVVGHEISHYLRRHSVQRMQDVVDKTNALIFIRMASALAGVGVVGDIATLGAMGSMQEFSRDNEREADGYGLALMVRAGYDPREAPKIWKRIIRESDAMPDKPQRDPFFATHPPSEERDSVLNELAASVDNADQLRVGRAAHVEALQSVWLDFFRDELAKRKYETTLELLDILTEDGGNVAYIHFMRGELFRARGEDGDIDLALEEYAKAAAAEHTPAELYRSQGLTLKRNGRLKEAREAFSIYLQRVPDAPDRAMIEAMTKGAI